MQRAGWLRGCPLFSLLFAILLVAGCSRSGALDPLSQPLIGATDGGGPVLAASPGTVLPGGTVTITLSGGAGNLKDWVGLYRAGDVDTNPLTWQYLSGTMTPPAMGMTSATLSFAMPATAGTYEF